MCAGLFGNKLLFVANYVSGMPGPCLLPAWRVNPLAKSCGQEWHACMYVRISINAGISLALSRWLLSWNKIFLYGCAQSLWSNAINTVV